MNIRMRNPRHPVCRDAHAKTDHADIATHYPRARTSGPMHTRPPAAQPYAPPSMPATLSHATDLMFSSLSCLFARRPADMVMPLYYAAAIASHKVHAPSPSCRIERLSPAPSAPPPTSRVEKRQIVPRGPTDLSEGGNEAASPMPPTVVNHVIQCHFSRKAGRTSETFRMRPFSPPTHAPLYRA